MGHDHAGDTGGESRVDDGMDLGPAEVPGGEHEPVAGDDVEHLREAALRQLHRPVRHSHRRELLLDRPPDRLLRRLRTLLVRLVLGVDRRQPDDPRASPGRDLDGLRVQSADAVVERDRAQCSDARHGGTHNRRPFRRRRVVRLEHEARQPELGEAPGEAEVVDAPLGQVWLDVDVKVVGAADELPGTIRGPDMDGSVAGCGKKCVLLGHRRRAFDVEGRDRLHPPSLPFRALGLRPDDSLVVGGEDQEAPRAHLDPVAARLVGVEEERLLDRVLVRAGLHHDAVLEKDVRGAQYVLALVDEVGDVVQPPAGPRQVARIRDVV